MNDPKTYTNPLAQRAAQLAEAIEDGRVLAFLVVGIGPGSFVDSHADPETLDALLGTVERWRFATLVNDHADRMRRAKLRQAGIVAN